MHYNFDEIIERKNTNSLKYDFSAKRGKPDRILPLWVADMDFQAPPCAIDALVDKSRHGVFGYSETDRDYFEALQKWFIRNFDWETDPDWLIETPGVVFAMCAAIRALTGKGDAVLIQQPVYYPFESAVISNGRKLVVSQLLYRDDKYSIDFEDFEEKIIRNKVKLFILCSPHNPVAGCGRKTSLYDWVISASTTESPLYRTRFMRTLHIRGTGILYSLLLNRNSIKLPLPAHHLQRHSTWRDYRYPTFLSPTARSGTRLSRR